MSGCTKSTIAIKKSEISIYHRGLSAFTTQQK